MLATSALAIAAALSCELKFVQVEVLPPPQVPLVPLRSTLHVRQRGSHFFEGVNLTDPAFNRPLLVPAGEFVDGVSIHAGGLPADFGPYGGPRIDTTRVDGTNRTRGKVVFSVSPRLAPPRVTRRGDEALQSRIVPGLGVRTAAVASGPILRDRLFWAAGLMFERASASLHQTFHAHGRARPFAQQDFAVPSVDAQAFAGLTWILSPKHRITATAIAEPRFARRSFRRTVDPRDPSADFPGQRPVLDPLTQRPATADGLVNGALGWDRSNTVAVTSRYEGRFWRDTLELEGRFGFVQAKTVEAWRIDDDALRYTEAQQWLDDEGRDLVAQLDAEEALHLAPGVRDECAGSSSACPVRRWTRGGIGRTQWARSRRAGGGASAIKYVNGRLPHKLKATVDVEGTERERRLRDSGPSRFRSLAAPPGIEERRVVAHNYAATASDEIRAGARLRVRAGVRWDAQDLRDGRGERLRMIAGNVAPRAFIAYDWTGEGRSRAYASFGWFYEQIPLALVDAADGIERGLQGQFDDEVTA
ncbi:MAG: TonB-dependent receptor, partial [Myxococcota bacterium]